MLRFFRIERPTTRDLAAGLDARRRSPAASGGCSTRTRRSSTRPVALRDDLPERLADDALGAREARAARRSSSRRAGGRRPRLPSSASRPTSVRRPSTGVWSSFQSPVWTTRPPGVSSTMATASGIECAMRTNSSAERPDARRGRPRARLAQLGRAQEAVLVELRLDEPERQPRRPDLGHADLAQQVRQRADVILVRRA